MRGAVLGILFAVVSTVSASGQAPRQCITLRLDLPHDVSREVSTEEGRATAGVFLDHGDSYREFYLDLTIRDLQSGIVLVSIHPDRQRDEKIEEFELQAGGSHIQTATTPSFAVSVVRIYERVGYRCMA